MKNTSITGYNWFERPIAHPHDAFFKWVFSQEEIARRFFQRYLPHECVGAVEWETLRMEVAGGNETALSSSLSMDLLFSVRWREGEAGADELMRPLLMFEHQSRIERKMAFRLLRYQVLAMRRAERQGGSMFPWVVPIVLHQGTEPWSAPRRLRELISIPERLKAGLGRWIPDFEYHVVDLAVESAETVSREDPELGLILRAMQAVVRGEVKTLVEWLAKKAEFPWDRELIAASLGYCLKTSRELDEREAQRIFEIEPSKQQPMDLAMKLANLWRAEGHEQGHEQGHEEGLQVGLSWGKLLGKLELLCELRGLPFPSPDEIRQMTVEELEARIAAIRAGETKE